MKKRKYLTSKKSKICALLILVVIIGLGTGGYLIMKNHDDSNKIIVAKASLPESTLKEGYLKTFFGSGGICRFDPATQIFLAGVGREKDGTPYASFGSSSQKSEDILQGINLKLGESAKLYQENTTNQIPNPPALLPEVGTVTLVSLGNEDNVQTVTILVKLTPEADKAYLEANKQPLKN